MKYLIPTLCAGLLVTGCATHLTTANAQGACDKVANYDLNFDRVDETLQQLAHATGCFVKTDDLNKIGAQKPHPVKGEMSIRNAVKTALKGTSIHISEETPNVITIE